MSLKERKFLLHSYYWDHSNNNGAKYETNLTVSEGNPPLLAYPLGILCIGDPFGDFRAESGTQVSYQHSVLSATMSPPVVSVI